MDIAFIISCIAAVMAVGGTIFSVLTERISARRIAWRDETIAGQRECIQQQEKEIQHLLTRLEEIGDAQDQNIKNLTTGLRALDARPGDVFVITTKERISEEQMGRIRKAWEASFKNYPVPDLIVVDDGAKLDIVQGGPVDGFTFGQIQREHVENAQRGETIRKSFDERRDRMRAAATPLRKAEPRLPRTDAPGAPDVTNMMTGFALGAAMNSDRSVDTSRISSSDSSSTSSDSGSSDSGSSGGGEG